MSKLESTQYDAALAVRGAWRGMNIQEDIFPHLNKIHMIEEAKHFC